MNKSSLPSPPRPSRVRDYALLVARCRRAALRLGLTVRVLSGTRGVPTIALVSPSSQRPLPKLMLSAGIHGDEPAPPEALIQILESSPTWLKDVQLTLFPCLNPWGFTRNIRCNAEGIDLNRDYYSETNPVILGARTLMENRGPFDLALCLHEDYDSDGFYLYEVGNKGPFWGATIVKGVSPAIPGDLRPLIDGWDNKKGVISRRRVHKSLFKRIGLPEAAWLFFHGSRRTYTMETPSEFHISQRIAAHKLAVETAIRLLLSQKSG